MRRDWLLIIGARVRLYSEASFSVVRERREEEEEEEEEEKEGRRDGSDRVRFALRISRSRD